MEPTIKQLILKRFRSLPSERISLDNPTVFVGRNGSGKSNLISAFSFLAEAMASPLQAVFEKAGGLSTVRNRTSGRGYPPNLGLRVDFGRMNGKAASGFYAFEVKALPDYGFSVVREQCSVVDDLGAHSWFDRRGTALTSNVGGVNPSLDPASLSLPVVGGEAKFAPVLRTLAAMRVYSIEPGKLREMQEPDSGTSLKSDGSNVTSVLREIERQSASDFERISAFLATIVPNTRQVRVKKHGKSLSLEFTQEWGEKKRLRLEGFSMSDGTLR
ncbi:MAG TPA: AAA family ATPase, partial [Thermoanaerobaculia bacterium]